MVIVDTTVWIDYLRGTPLAHVEWLDHELDLQPLGLLDLILCELLHGVSTEKEATDLEQSLEPFIVYDTGGRSLAIAAAKNYRLLRASGITIRKTIDCLIATYCIQNKYALLHNDRDFDAFEQELGLLVVHP